MSKICFTNEHEWIRLDGDIATVGVTDHAQHALGDVVFVELPSIGRHVTKGDAVAVVESVKAASDVYSPVGGDVVEANGTIVDQPSLVNESAEQDGWFFKLRLHDASELEGLMDRAAYDRFVAEFRLMRYLPLTEQDRKAMLAAIGVGGIDDLFRDVPESARRQGLVDLPLHAGEMEVEACLSRLAARNLSAATAPLFIGAGAYRHHVPASVDALIQRGEFLTSYTPYQPEVSQGTLQYLFEFQSQVALITGMEVANASLYDGATATSEAAAMANRITKRPKVILSGDLHPHYRSVTATALQYTGIEIDALAPDPTGIEDLIGRLDEETACVIVQNPGFFGRLRDLSALAAACHAEGALLVVAVTEPVSLGLVTSPGAMGADIVIAEGQSIGNSLNYGGPGLGLFATREKYLRQMPGRLVGQTLDQDGKRGWVLTLSTREQHIRREKATSNICTNSGLCALAFTIHLAMLGETGFHRLGKLNHWKAVTLAEKLARLKQVKLLSASFFNEFAVLLPKPADEVVEALAGRGILAGVPASRFYPNYPELAEVLLLAATETNSEAEMDQLVAALAEVL